MKISNKTLSKIIVVLLSVVSVVVIVSIIGFILWSSLSKTGSRYADGNQEDRVNISETETSEDDVYDDDNIPSKTFFALYGVDRSKKLSDVIIVACLDKRTGSLNTISVPRDTFVKLPQDRLDILKENGLWAPKNGMKITELHSYSGKFSNEFMTLQLEEMFNIPIDYYFEIDLDAFVKIVDAVGGVEIDVPNNMYYYDPTQKLKINIKRGLQTLDGENAQGFVRFRQYRDGDIERIEMQKLFLKSLMSKILDKETFLSNAPEFLSIFLENVTTNMTIGDGLRYINLIKDIDYSSVKMETLPGDGHTPYKYDEYEAIRLANRLFYGINEEDESETESEDKAEINQKNKKMR